jgi:peptidoglycan-associated lipoprotein
MKKSMVVAGALVAGFTSLAMSTGCAGKDIPPPAAPAPTMSESITQTTSATTPGPRAGNLRASDELIKRCQLDVNHKSTAPKFDFDKAQIVGDDASVLDQVAQCLTSGPLKGEGVKLVGRADPRGEQEYNMVLGSSRADSVASYLESAGVDAGRVTTTSRGKLDATGTDEAGWQMDRRVDIDVR